MSWVTHRFLREHRDEIVAEWERSSRADRGRAVELEDSALRDHVPELLDELADWLEGSEQPGGERMRAAAAAHARGRIKDAYQLSQVISELAILRSTILAHLLRAEAAQGESPEDTGAERRVLELARLNAGLDHAITDVVEGFVAETDRARRAAETSLRDSEERFRALLEPWAQAVWETRGDGTVDTDSPSWRAYTGQSQSEWLSGAWLDAIHPEDRDLASRTWQTTVAARRPVSAEFRLRGPDGSWRWTNVRVVPLLAPDGSVRRWVGMNIDVTEQHRAADTLRASEARLRGIFEANPIGVVRGDDQGRILDANAAYLRLVGYSRGDLDAGRIRWDAITPPQYLPADATAIAQARERGVSDVYEKEYRRTDGARVPVLVACAISDHGKELTAFVVDISDRRRAELALREADRRKNEFLGMLSHELRNPLAPIRNALFILDHVQPNGEQARRARDIVNRQVAHLTRLVDDLLDTTRIARGRIELRQEDLDLAELARRTAEDFRALIQDRGLELVVEIQPDGVTVHGDPARITQILGNLLNNAAKFTRPGGRVALRVAAREGKAVVRVRDTGVGIAPEVLPTIFEPFTQGSQTLARSEGGLGLGLALVKGLVALHGGDVTAQSRGPGQGTDFVVTLPLVQPRPSASEGEGMPHARGSRHGLSILVVDDNRDAADTLSELLEMLGHSVRVAYDALDGLARAKEATPDVVLCDIGLPGMDGYEFARRFRAIAGQRHVRLVALSGYAQPEDVTRATEAGFDAHIAKPPDPSRVALIVQDPVSRADGVRPAPLS